MTVEAQLAAYFLDAVRKDVEVRISTYEDKGGQEYAPIPFLPWLAKKAVPLVGDVAKVVDNAQIGKGSVRIGYPLLLRRVGKRGGGAFWKVEPVLVFASGLGPAHPGFDDIEFNRAALDFIAPDGGAAATMFALKLAAAIGLDAGPPNQPVMTDIKARLRQECPLLPWPEQVDPANLDAPAAWFLPAGTRILNRAAVFVDKTPDYTRGLVQELKCLAGMKLASDFEGTALAALVRGITEPVGAAPDVIDVVPLNQEQREAVSSALVRPVTVITGPPGTGKSQVVTGLIANAVFHGQTVLFASRNHKAVDVVEARVSALSERPVLLRIKSQAAILPQLQDMIAAALAGFTPPGLDAEAAEAFRQARRVRDEISRCEQRLTALRAAGEEVIESELAVADLRAEVGQAGLQLLATAPLEAAALLRACEAALDRADVASLPPLLRWIWPLLRESRQRRLEAGWQAAIPALEALSVAVAPEAQRKKLTQALQRLARRGDAVRYMEALRRVSDSETDSELAAQLVRLAHERHRVDERRWQNRIAARVAGLSAKEKKMIATAGKLLAFALGAGGDGLPNPDWKSLIKNVRPLVGAWAVTSLSARGKVPLEKACFDLLIVDEASMCDIASVLPLLYRARRVAVLGDPMQLTHISSLSAAEDHKLLTEHGLFPDRVAWSYTASSFYAISAMSAGSGGMVRLLDHHRSHPDIVGFSNRHFYGAALRVATPETVLKFPAKLEKAITWVPSKGPIFQPATGSVVQPDVAERTIVALRKLLIDQGYPGTVGIVTPFRAQKERIIEFLREDKALLAAATLANCVVDTVHGFQGDERDTMLFSVVMGPDMPPGPAGFLKGTGNLFNVAITRARSALLVVGDKEAAAKSCIPHLEAFAAYVDTLSDVTAALPPVVDHGPEFPAPQPNWPKYSEEECVLYRALYAAGLMPQPQYRVEGYWLDLAILIGNVRLDVEVDGMQHLLDADQVKKDQLRTGRLIELGWHVMRIWAHEVRSDPAACVARVENWLRMRGVQAINS